MAQSDDEMYMTATSLRPKLYLLNPAVNLHNVLCDLAVQQIELHHT